MPRHHFDKKTLAVVAFCLALIAAAMFLAWALEQ